MKHWFKSDNTSTACPEVMDALLRANEGHAAAYGDDDLSRRLDRVFADFFGCPVRVFPVATGTAANTTALAAITPPYGAIVTHEYSHIVRDECGAPEFMTGGARLLPMPGANGRLNRTILEQALADNPASVHTVQPAAVSITQATEFGTVYRPDALADLTACAHARGLHVHMDGARFANAMATLGGQPGDVTWRSGVDVLSFGATKNGAIAAEAVVFFNTDLVRDYEFRRKRAGHLLSKMRYVSAQLLAYVESGAWLRNARAANAGAQRIADAAGARLVYPVEANELFLKLGDAAIATLRTQGFAFYDWGATGSGEARFVVSWNQSDADVNALCAALTALPR